MISDPCETSVSSLASGSLHIEFTTAGNDLSRKNVQVEPIRWAQMQSFSATMSGIRSSSSSSQFPNLTCAWAMMRVAMLVRVEVDASAFKHVSVRGMQHRSQMRGLDHGMRTRS